MRPSRPLRLAVLEPYGFRDLDFGIWANPASVSRQAAMDHEFAVSGWLERTIAQPVDVKVLDYAPVSDAAMTCLRMGDSRATIVRSTPASPARRRESYGQPRSGADPRRPPVGAAAVLAIYSWHLA